MSKESRLSVLRRIHRKYSYYPSHEDVRYLLDLVTHLETRLKTAEIVVMEHTYPRPLGSLTLLGPTATLSADGRTIEHEGTIFYRECGE